MCSMPDLWDDVPIELLGERPTVPPFLNKSTVKPVEVENVEKGRDEGDGFTYSFGVTETK